MYRLIFQSGSLKGHRKTVTQSTVVLGNADSCYVVLDDPSVGDEQIRLEWNNAGISIQALGVSAVMLINGAKTTEGVLHEGDVVLFGSTEFQLQATETLMVDRARRASTVQTITFIAIAIIILFEVIFLAALSMWRKEDSIPPDQSAAEAMAEPPLVSDSANKPPEPVPTSSPTPEATPTSVSTATSVPMPTATPEPTATPTATPKPTATPRSTATPKPTATPTPTPTPVPVRKTVEEHQRDIERLISRFNYKGNAISVVAEELLQEGIIAWAKGAYDEAESKFKQAEIVDPKYYPSYIKLAELFEELNKISAARHQWKLLIRRSKRTYWQPYAKEQLAALDKKQE